MSTALIALLELGTTVLAIACCAIQVFAASRSLDAEARSDTPAAISWPVDGDRA